MRSINQPANILQPKSGTTSADGSAFIIQHTTPVTETQILDEFGAYPMDLAGVITTRPSNWWPQKEAPSSESTGAGVQIIPATSRRARTEARSRYRRPIHATSPSCALSLTPEAGEQTLEPSRVCFHQGPAVARECDVSIGPLLWTNHQHVPAPGDRALSLSSSW